MNANHFYFYNYQFYSYIDDNEEKKIHFTTSNHHNIRKEKKHGYITNEIDDVYK